ncbi:MAG: nuclear transport factor 2 family protein [Sphingomonadaceae bacterium]|nr:nuclear transport factor 2 family protein [Sphingomonadaceae bacterium]
MPGKALALSAALVLAASAAPALADHHETAPAGCTMNARQVVEAFIPLFYEQRNATEAFARWVHPDYIQHNPMAPDGAAAAVGFLQPFFDANPQMRYVVHRVIAEDGLVVVHNQLQMNADDRGSAVVDIFRVEKCKIVEHWDIIQPVPEKSANANTMF